MIRTWTWVRVTVSMIDITPRTVMATMLRIWAVTCPIPCLFPSSTAHRASSKAGPGRPSTINYAFQEKRRKSKVLGIKYLVDFPAHGLWATKQAQKFRNFPRAEKKRLSL